MDKSLQSGGERNLWSEANEVLKRVTNYKAAVNGKNIHFLNKC